MQHLLECKSILWKKLSQLLKWFHCIGMNHCHCLPIVTVLLYHCQCHCWVGALIILYELLFSACSTSYLQRLLHCTLHFHVFEFLGCPMRFPILEKVEWFIGKSWVLFIATNSLEKELAVAYTSINPLAAWPINKIWCNASTKFKLKSS